eukprot:CAMPEP_0118681058 /NCGR_PEP_ID=MMETSP0800-20121206/4724_1 /TAXON_ID=210618 ORGANISM="Striatella unipunctata, Strain CCMP2910" /NCGR_SAMPLE_ID=MMETSP0800 /ASSEMBLY_ACC=CAM_ASM_000638 /LENGTH=255 /DNA_ID=CAMNT_0006577305 /DNA_START=95 /DNA_END=859 /DNA_ORIENTATION=-
MMVMMKTLLGLNNSNRLKFAACLALAVTFAVACNNSLLDFGAVASIEGVRDGGRFLQRKDKKNKKNKKKIAVFRKQIKNRKNAIKDKKDKAKKKIKDRKVDLDNKISQKKQKIDEIQQKINDLKNSNNDGVTASDAQPDASPPEGDFGIRFSKVNFPESVSIPNDFLPLQPFDFPVQGGTEDLLRQSYVHSVVTQKDHEVQFKIEELIESVGGLPTHAANGGDDFWVEFREVIVQQNHRRNGVPAAEVFPLAGIW